MDIADAQRREIAFWIESKDECPGSRSIYNLINKISEAAIFVDCLDRYQCEIPTFAGRVLELGAGQGWASCIYKKRFPDAHVTVTDISPYAVMSLSKWERVFDISVDHFYACRSHATAERADSLDIIFCFAAAHHFRTHRRTLQEIARTLKPGGKAFFFYEPTTPRYLYPLAYRRVNRKRLVVPEDVLILSSIRNLAAASGLDVKVDYYPSVQKRGVFEVLYYTVLGQLPVLQRLLPCTANFIFSKAMNDRK